MQFHYDIGGKTYLSPLSFGRPDPIEEFAIKLRANGDKDSYQMARKLEAKTRTFLPVVVRGEEAQGVKFWGFGKLVNTELMEFFLDEDYGDISDPLNGRDITVKFIPKEETGANFPKTTIRVKPNQTPLTENKAQLDALLNNQKDIREVYQELTYDDLKDALVQYLNPTDEEEDTEVTDTPSPQQAEVTSQSATAADFDDLFNKAKATA
jgi:hypothetical protein